MHPVDLSLTRKAAFEAFESCESLRLQKALEQCYVDAAEKDLQIRILNDEVIFLTNTYIILNKIVF